MSGSESEEDKTTKVSVESLRSSDKVKALAYRSEISPAAEIPPGTVIDERFRIVELIGAGGMSLIYRASQLPMERPVVLKFIALDAGDKNAVQRFGREATATSQMDHPNIVRVHAFGFSAYGPYMAMEYLPGKTLSELIAAGAVPEPAAVKIFKQMAAALAHAHGRGIVHRDIKPSNVLIVTDPDGSQTAKLLDFGLARITSADGTLEQKLTSTGMVLGSLPYMSPEQCQGSKVDQRSDIYSLGCLMFEVLAGRQPFACESAFQLLACKMAPDVKELMQGIAGTSKQVQAIVLKAMAPDPQKRWASAQELLQALESGCTSAGWQLYRQGLAERSRALMPVVLVLLAGLLALALFTAGSKFLEEKSTIKAARTDMEIQNAIDEAKDLPEKEYVQRLRGILAELTSARAGNASPNWSLQATVYTMLGKYYVDNTDFDQGLELLQKAEQAARRAGLITDRREYAQALYYESIALRGKRRIKESYAKIKEAIRVSERGLSMQQRWPHALIFDYQNELANCQADMGNWRQAEKTLDRLLAVSMAICPHDHERAYRIWKYKAQMYSRLSQALDVPPAEKERFSRLQKEARAISHQLKDKVKQQEKQAKQEAQEQ